MPANIMIPLDFKSLGYNHWTDVEKKRNFLIQPFTQTITIPKDRTVDGEEYKVSLSFGPTEMQNTGNIGFFNRWLPAKLQTYSTDGTRKGMIIRLK